MVNILKTNYSISEKRERLLLMLIILINLIIKLIPATILELGNDEVYYWTYALFPDWSHFDHPPMVGLTIQLFSLNLALKSELIIRLGSLILSSINIIILFYLVKKIYTQRAAFISTLLFTSSFYFNIISGLFILPDTPQIFFILLALYFGLPSVTSKSPDKSDGQMIILFGFFSGLALLSKYSSLFLWTGFGIYILFHNRLWLRKPSLYISVLITLILMTPVLYWNMINNFISFTFHSNRISLFNSPFNLNTFIQFNAGQIFYQNPALFVVFILAFISLFRKRKEKINEINLIFIYLSVPFILVFTLFSMYRNTLPHWTGPAFICLIMLSSKWLSDLYETKRKKVFNTLLTANLLFILIVIIGTIQIRYGIVLPINKEPDPTKLGRKDFTLDMYGWDQAGKQFSQFLMKEKIPLSDYNRIKIISNNWFPAAHIDFYIAHPLKIDLIVSGDLEAAHKYFWINKTRPCKAEDRFFFITSSQQYYSPEGFNSSFTGIIPRDTLGIMRNGTLVKNLFIYEMTGFKADSTQHWSH